MFEVVKKFLVILLFAFFVSFGMIFLTKGSFSKTEYRGKITQMYKQSAYKGSVENHVVFYCDSLKRKIDVEVTDNQYVNLVVGQSYSKKLYPNQTK